MKVLVDGTALYAINSDVINTGLKINRGTRQLRFRRPTIPAPFQLIDSRYGGAKW